MSYIKTNTEIQHIRVSCRIASEVLGEVIAAAKPGVTTLALDRLATELTKKRGAVPSFTGYQDFKFALCVSINDEVVHGLPTQRKLKTGDIVGLDFGVKYRGFYSDLARTVPIGNVSPEADELIAVTKLAIARGIAAVKPGNRVGDIGHAVQSLTEPKGYGIVRDLVGHGVGTAVHEPPAIPNFGKPNTGEQLVAGMVLAIEPMINKGTHRVVLGDDGWTFKTRDGSLSAHFEDTVLVTERGHEILTQV